MEEEVGPDPNDLHLDLFYETKSRWNKKVHQLLLNKVKEASAEWDGLEAVTDAYMLDAIQSRCDTLIKKWNTARKRDGETGITAAARWAEDLEKEKKATRQRKRRATVSPSPNASAWN